MNIVLISRTESKLVDVSKEIGKHEWFIDWMSSFGGNCAAVKFNWPWVHAEFISFVHSNSIFPESLYGVKTKYIVADFGTGKEIYDNIRRELQLLDIGILINNVGRMYDFPDELDNISESLLWQIININVGAVTMMTRAVIPQMKINKRGIIVNISSGSECQPAPLMTVYGATKVYVKNFTLGEWSDLVSIENTV